MLRDNFLWRALGRYQSINLFHETNDEELYFEPIPASPVSLYPFFIRKIACFLNFDKILTNLKLLAVSNKLCIVYSTTWYTVASLQTINSSKKAGFTRCLNTADRCVYHTELCHTLLCVPYYTVCLGRRNGGDQGGTCSPNLKVRGAVPPPKKMFWSID